MTIGTIAAPRKVRANDDKDSMPFFPYSAVIA
jgi:hypothetical protein